MFWELGPHQITYTTGYKNHEDHAAIPVIEKLKRL